eukprot:c19101_g2_i1 orf=26-448(-)
MGPSAETFNQAESSHSHGTSSHVNMAFASSLSSPQAELLMKERESISSASEVLVKERESHIFSLKGLASENQEFLMQKPAINENLGNPGGDDGELFMQKLAIHGNSGDDDDDDEGVLRKLRTTHSYTEESRVPDPSFSTN